MDEITDPGKMPEPIHSEERVGEILRNERERRGVSVNVIAKDLRLNPRFIEALESDDYSLLPGDTYIRVYLRSLSRYFSLNADALLERFFKERGLSGVDTLRKDSSTKINLAALREREKPNKTVILAASVFIILALLCYVASRQGWFSSTVISSGSSGTDSTSLRNKHGDSVAARVEKAADTLVADSAGVYGPELEQPLSTHDSIVDAEAKRKAVKDSIIEARARKKDSILEAKARKKAVKDSILEARARGIFLKDSIRGADDKNRASRDSAAKAEVRSKAVRDSLLMVEVKNRNLKDSVLKAEAKNKAFKDSLLKVEARNKAVRDSALKADARSKAVRDSLLQAEARSKAVKDSILKIEARTKAAKDSALAAEAKSKIALEEILKAEAKGKAVKDSILKAEARKKAARDSALKAEAKNKNGKDTVKTTLLPGAAKTAPENTPAMELKLAVTGQSAWARILSDGSPWRNILYKGAARTFTAKDSFNLRTGQLEDMTLTLNGKKLDVPSKGIIALKIDRSGITVWTDDQWFKLTKGRF